MTLDRATAEAVLFTEARLLDERRFEDWLDLFSKECRYWLPILDGDDEMEPSIIRDDRARMEERVFRLLDTPAHAQRPPSRTQHDLSNVEVLEGDAPGEARVRCNLVVHEMRVGDPSQVGLGAPRLFAGRCEYVLRDEGGWLIALKKVQLLDREQPQYNLTFIV